MDRLWVDKYRPKTLDTLDYHFDLSFRLQKLSKMQDFPHLLLYGPNGAGKKTRVMAFLSDVYGSGVTKLKSEQREFKASASSSNTVECNIISSNYHLDITPSDAEFHDKVIVQNLIKEVASTSQLDSKSQRAFKVIIINEVDQLSKEAQAALRRTMEKYISKCRLILICENLGRVIPPIRSRCLMIRVAAPTELEIQVVLEKISKKENMFAQEGLCAKIAKECERNLRRSVIQLQTCKMQKSLTVDQKLHVPEWKLAINSIADDVRKEQTPKKLREIRDKVYDLLINCIPGDLIIKYILKELCNYVDTNWKYQMVYWAAYHENKMQMGNKPVFHIEAFLARMMFIYKKYAQDYFKQ